MLRDRCAVRVNLTRCGAVGFGIAGSRRSLGKRCRPGTRASECLRCTLPPTPLGFLRSASRGCTVPHVPIPRRAAAMAADVRAPLPVATGSAGVVLSVVGPRNPVEVVRVVTGHGTLIVASVRRASVRAACSRRGIGVDPHKPLATAGLSPVCPLWPGRASNPVVSPAEPTRLRRYPPSGRSPVTRTRRTCCSARLRPHRRPERARASPAWPATTPTFVPALERTAAPGPGPVDAATRCDAAEEQPTVGRRGRAGTGRVQQAFSGSTGPRWAGPAREADGRGEDCAVATRHRGAASGPVCR